MILAIVLVLSFLSMTVLVWGLLPDPWLQMVRRRIYGELSKTKRPSLVEQVGNLFMPLNRRLPLTWYYREITKTLEAAGLRVAPIHFLAMQEIGALVWALLYFITMGRPINLAWLGLFMVMGFFVPVVWLHNRIKARRMTIARDLPELADLLNLCVGAGSDFVTAMARIVRDFRPCPVSEELGIVLQEIRVGKRRSDALRAFATRLKTPEASNFARTLIQVDRMGTGLAESLKIMSEDMRLTRYHWAERFAQQAPMKMLIPLLISLASAMIIVAGPILLKFFRGDLMMTPQMTTQSQ